MYFVTFFVTNSLKTRLLSNGRSTWRLTRFSDDLFVGKNSFGRTKTFRCQAEVEAFEDFLLTKGYSLVQKGRSLDTLVRKPVEA